MQTVKISFLQESTYISILAFMLGSQEPHFSSVWGWILLPKIPQTNKEGRKKNDEHCPPQIREKAHVQLAEKCLIKSELIWGCKTGEFGPENGRQKGNGRWYEAETLRAVQAESCARREHLQCQSLPQIGSFCLNCKNHPFCGEMRWFWQNCLCGAGSKKN